MDGQVETIQEIYMNDRKLLVLAVIAVVMAGLAILQNRMTQKVNRVDFGSSALIEGLDTNAVSSLEITSDSGKETMTLSRSGDFFVVVDKDDYPADISKINTLINNCLDIRTYDLITKNPDNHTDLKVTRETAQYVVSFRDKDNKEIVGIAISEADEDRNAFVRLLSGNEVFSVKSPPMINTQPMDYIDAQLIQVDQNMVQSVAVRTGEDIYILSSPQDSDDIQMETMPEGKQFKENAYKSVFGGLGSIRFDDVKAVNNIPDGLEFNINYTCKLYDKTVYKLVLAQQDDKTFAKFSSDFLDKTPVEKERRVESEEALKEKEAKLMAIDNVTSFNQKHQGWVYQIPSYKAGDLTKPLSELIEDIPVPETPQETEAESGTEDGEEQRLTEAAAEGLK